MAPQPGRTVSERVFTTRHGRLIPEKLKLWTQSYRVITQTARREAKSRLHSWKPPPPPCVRMRRRKKEEEEAFVQREQKRQTLDRRRRFGRWIRAGWAANLVYRGRTGEINKWWRVQMCRRHFEESSMPLCKAQLLFRSPFVSNRLWGSIWAACLGLLLLFFLFFPLETNKTIQKK